MPVTYNPKGSGEHAPVHGRQFDSPLIMRGSIDAEPERYVAEKPYDLTRFEYSILKKPYVAEFWFNIISGATAGLVISVIGKSISALIDNHGTKLDTWEIVAVIMGVTASILLKYCFKSDEDKEKDKLMDVVNGHFANNKPRRLHLTRGGENER